MSNCIHCNIEVHPKRVEILNRTGASITCLEHSATQKVVGFKVSDAKSTFLEVCTPEQKKRLDSLDRKGNHATGAPNPKQGKVVYKGTK